MRLLWLVAMFVSRVGCYIIRSETSLAFGKGQSGCGQGCYIIRSEAYLSRVALFALASCVPYIIRKETASVAAAGGVCCDARWRDRVLKGGGGDGGIPYAGWRCACRRCAHSLSRCGECGGAVWAFCPRKGRFLTQNDEISRVLFALVYKKWYFCHRKEN